MIFSCADWLLVSSAFTIELIRDSYSVCDAIHSQQQPIYASRTQPNAPKHITPFEIRFENTHLTNSTKLICRGWCVQCTSFKYNTHLFYSIFMCRCSATIVPDNSRTPYTHTPSSSSYVKMASNFQLANFNFDSLRYIKVSAMNVLRNTYVVCSRCDLLPRIRSSTF